MPDMTARRDMLNEYLSNGIATVEGWCLPQLWQSIWPLYKEIGDGPIAEIGVFEGKFFIGLAKTFGTGPNCRAAAIDVFDMQEFNLDNAGKGKLDVFRKNLDLHAVGADNVECIAADSLALTIADAISLVEKMGKFRVFSVDGCHEVEHTTRDIEFAMQVTDNAGIIAVDDYTNPHWPGVIEAVHKMYLLRDFAFVPLLVTSNKLLLCSYSYHARYLDSVRSYVSEHHPGTRIKKVRRLGYDTLTIMPNLQKWTDLV